MGLDITEYQKWNDKARELLDSTGKNNKSDMKRRNDEVAELLKTMKKEENLYAGFEDLFEEYKEISRRSGFALLNSTNGASKSDKRESTRIIEQSCKDLRKLKKKMRLELGAVDPTATKEVRAAVLEEAEEKPVYLDKRQRILDAINELKALPGTKETVEKLRNLLTIAEDLEPDYKAAHGKLDGLSGLFETGLKKAKSFETDLPKDLKASLKAAREELAEYEKVAGVADATGVDESNAEIKFYLSEYDKAGTDRKNPVASMCVMSLDLLTAHLKKKREKIAAMLPDLTEAENTARQQMSDILNWAPVDVIASIRPRYLTATALSGSQQYTDAQKAFADFADELKQLHEAHEKYFNDWKDIDQQLESGLKDAIPRAKKTGDPVLSTVGSNLETTITMTLRAQMIPGRQYKKALDFVKSDKVLEDLAELLKQVRRAEDKQPVDPQFANEELKLKMEVARLSAAVKEATAGAQTAVDNLKKAGGLSMPFETRISTIGNNWTQAASPFTDTSFPLEDRKNRLPLLITSQKDVIKELGLVKSEAAEIRDNKPKLLASKNEKDKLEEKAIFDEAEQEARDAIAYLEDFGLPDKHPLLTANPSLTQIRTDFDLWVQGGVRDPSSMGILAKINTDALEKRKQIEQSLAESLRLAQAREKKLKKTLDDLFEAYSSYEPYFESLRDQVTSAIGMVGSSVVTVSLVGGKQLDEIEEVITKLSKELKTKGVDNFLAVEAKLKELKNQLDDSDLKDYEAISQATLSKRLKEVVPGTLRPLSPKEALAKLGEFENEIKAASVRAGKAKEARKKLETNAGLAEQNLKPLKDTYPNLYDSLSKRIEKAKGSAKGSESSALVEIATIETLIKTAGLEANGVKNGVAMDKKIVCDKLEAERSEKEYQAAKRIFNSNAKKKAEDVKSEYTKLFGLMVSSECNTDAFDQMEAVEKEAEKLAGNGDHKGAIAKLKQATAQARYFVSHPMNPAAAARKELKGLNASWKAAVSGYLKSLVALREKIVEEGEKDQTVGIVPAEEAAKKLHSLARLFNAAVFEESTRMLSEPAKAIEETPARRATKEYGLLIIHRYQRTIAKHALYKKAAVNPFRLLAVKPLTIALKSLDAAFQAS